MAQGLTGELVWTAGVVGLFGYWIARKDLPPLLAFLAVMVKILIPLVYFAWYYDSIWNFIDDLTYYGRGEYLLNQDFTPLNILTQTKGLITLVSLSNSEHILYIWWNYLAQYLIGPYYFAPVFLNIGLTFLTGRYLYRISRKAGFGKSYSRGLLLFFLLHWDILAWSSLVNLKDILILLLTVAALYYLLCVALPAPGQPKRWICALWLAALFAIFLVIRFYIPVLMLSAFGAWLFLKLRGWRKVVFLSVAIALLLFTVTRYVLPQLSTTRMNISLNPISIVVGLVRFSLTPQPWAIETNYSFLLLPSLLHWLLYLPSLTSLPLLWRRSPAMVLLILYFLIVNLFYSGVEELLGPRPRVQLVFMWVWLQYNFLVTAYRVRVMKAAQRAALPPMGVWENDPA